jgi:hypothetical protein
MLAARPTLPLPPTREALLPLCLTVGWAKGDERCIARYQCRGDNNDFLGGHRFEATPPSLEYALDSPFVRT